MSAQRRHHQLLVAATGFKVQQRVQRPGKARYGRCGTPRHAAAPCVLQPPDGKSKKEKSDAGHTEKGILATQSEIARGIAHILALGFLAPPPGRLLLKTQTGFGAAAAAAAPPSAASDIPLPPPARPRTGALSLFPAKPKINDLNTNMNPHASRSDAACSISRTTLPSATPADRRWPL